MSIDAEKNPLVELLCSRCGQVTAKRLKYLVRRIRQEKTRFFCSRSCADKSHSELMVGDGNPNYEGTYHGTQPFLRPKEEWEDIRRKISETMVTKGVSKGENNPRWSGGLKPVTCLVCSTQYEVRPYVYRAISSGERNPLCSPACVGSYVSSYGPKHGTSIEVKMREELQRRNIEFVEQHVLNRKFSFDFFLPQFSLAIECDGDYWHNLPDVARKDRAKNAYVAACGIKMLRFWEHEIKRDISACVDLIETAIEEAARVAA